MKAAERLHQNPRLAGDDLAVLLDAIILSAIPSNLANLRSNKVTGAKLEEAEVAWRDAPLRAQAEDIIGRSLNPEDVKDWRRHANAISALPLLPNIPIAATTPGLPAHAATPLGDDALVVFTMVYGTRPAGKKIIVNDGKVIRTEATPPRGTFHTILNVGASDLEDVRHWAMIAANPDSKSYITRSWMGEDYAPGFEGVRRAFNRDEEYGRFDRPAFTERSTVTRLIVLDIDGVVAPDEMDIGDLDQVLSYILTNYCPEEMAPGLADILVTPSTSYGSMAGDGSGKLLGLRLFALADRALSGAELAAWAPKREDGGCDPKMGTVGQPVYCLRMAYDDATSQPAPDPFASICWQIFKGADRHVRLPAEIKVESNSTEQGSPKRRSDRVAADAGNKSSASIGGKYRSGDEAFADIGDLKSGGIYGALIEGIGHKLGVRESPVLDDARIKAVTREAIAAITAGWPRTRAGQSSADYIRIAPGTVRDIARRELQQRKKRERDLLALLAGNRELPTRNAEEVFAELKVNMELAVEMAILFAKARAVDVALMINTIRDRPSNRGKEFFVGAPLPADAEQLKVRNAQVAEYLREVDAEAKHLIPGWGRPSGFGLYRDDDELTAIYEPTTPIPLPTKYSAEIAHNVYDLLPDEITGSARVRLALQEAGLMSPQFAWLATVTVGVGKTTAAMAVAAEMAAKGETVVWTTADHDLAAETAENLPGLKTYRGLGDAKAQPVGWCLNEEKRRLWQLAGGGTEDFCHGFCPFRRVPEGQRCGYLEQEVTLAGATVQGFADGLGCRTRPTPKVCRNAGWKSPTLVIVDEPSVARLVSTAYAIPASWMQKLNGFDAAQQMLDKSKGGHLHTRSEAEAAKRAIDDWLERVASDFTNNPSHAGVKFTVDRARAVKPNFSHQYISSKLMVRPASTGVKDAIFDDAAAFEVLKSYNGRVRMFANFARALNQLDLAGVPGATVIPGWHFSREIIGGAWGEAETLCLVAPYRSDVAMDWDGVPMILLDATAQDSLAKQITPGIAVARFEAKEQYTTTTVHLVPSGKDTWTERAVKIDRWAREQATNGDLKSVGVITHKQAANAIRGFYAESQPPFHLMHFNAVRGRNAMANVAVLGVFGRTLPRAEDVAATATALTGVPTSVESLTKIPAVWRSRQGELTLGERWSAGLGLPDGLLREAVESGVAQAVGRGRGVRRTAANPLEVHVFLDCVVDGIIIDELVGTLFEDLVELWKLEIKEYVETVGTPIGRTSGFWQRRFNVKPEAWRQRRQAPAGFADGTIGAWLDGAEDAARERARLDPAIKVSKIENGWLIHSGECDGVSLAGRPRRDALRQRG